jgi:hypothetical protein
MKLLSACAVTLSGSLLAAVPLHAQEGLFITPAAYAQQLTAKTKTAKVTAGL